MPIDTTLPSPLIERPTIADPIARIRDAWQKKRPGDPNFLAIVTGEDGLGKTTLLKQVIREFGKSVHSDRFRPSDPHYYDALFRAFGVERAPGDLIVSSKVMKAGRLGYGLFKPLADALEGVVDVVAELLLPSSGDEFPPEGISNALGKHLLKALQKGPRALVLDDVHTGLRSAWSVLRDLLRLKGDHPLFVVVSLHGQKDVLRRFKQVVVGEGVEPFEHGVKPMDRPQSDRYLEGALPATYAAHLSGSVRENFFNATDGNLDRASFLTDQLRHLDPPGESAFGTVISRFHGGTLETLRDDPVKFRLLEFFSVLYHCGSSTLAPVRDPAVQRIRRELAGDEEFISTPPRLLTKSDLVEAAGEISGEFWGPSRMDMMKKIPELQRHLDEVILDRVYAEVESGGAELLAESHEQCVAVLTRMAMKRAAANLPLARAHHLDHALRIKEREGGAAETAESYLAFASAERGAVEPLARIEALERARELVDAERKAGIDLEMARILNRRGRGDLAKRCLDRAREALFDVSESAASLLRLRIDFEEGWISRHQDPKEGTARTRRLIERAERMLNEGGERAEGIRRVVTEARVLLAHCLMASFALDEAEAVCEEVLREGRADRIAGQIEAEAHRILGLVLRQRDDSRKWKAALGHFEEAIERASGDPARAAELLSLRAQLLSQLGEHDRAVEQTDGAAVQARAAGDPFEEGRAYAVRAEVEARRGNPGGVAEWRRRNLDLLEKIQPRNSPRICENLGQLALSLIDTGDLDGARAIVADYREEINRIPGPERPTSDAYLHWISAELAAAELPARDPLDAQLARKALGLCRRAVEIFTNEAAYKRALPNVFVLMARLYRRCGDPRACIETLGRADARPWDSYERPAYYNELGRALFATGDENGARIALAKGARLARTYRNPRAQALFEDAPVEIPKTADLTLTFSSDWGPAIAPGEEVDLPFRAEDFERAPVSGLELCLSLDPAGIVESLSTGRVRTDANGKAVFRIRAGAVDGIVTVRAAEATGGSDDQDRLAAEVKVEVSSVPIDVSEEFARKAGAHSEMEPAERVLCRRLYAGAKRIGLLAQFGGGYSGSRVVLVRHHEPRGGRGQAAPTVLKLAHQRATEDEFDRYDELVRPFITTQVARATHHGTYEGIGAIRSELASGRLDERTRDLARWLEDGPPPAGELRRLAAELFDELLGEGWYRNGEPASTTRRDQLASIIPFVLVLDCTGPESGVWTQRPPGWDPPTPLDRALAWPPTLAVGERVALEELIVRESKGATLQLCDARDMRVELRFPAGTNLNAYEAGRPAFAAGAVASTTYRTLEDGLGRLLSGESTAPLRAEIPRLTAKMARVVNDTCTMRRSTVHGDLHLRNVLIDRNDLPWIIDFGLTRESLTLFDFVKLETSTVRYALAGDPEIAVEQMLGFEEALAAEPFGRPDPPASVKHPRLAALWPWFQAIREQALPYLGREGDTGEYLDTLFFCSLCELRYHGTENEEPESARQGLFLALHAAV